MTGQNQELELLKLATKTEQDGRQMYLDAVAKAANPLAKSTFAQLAKEELVHIEMIKGFYESIKSRGEGKVSEELEKAMSYDLRKRTIFELAKDRMDETVAADPDVIEAYKAAMKFEEEGAKMYEEAAKTTDNPLAKKLYTFIYEQESEHYRLLAETLYYLENPNQWFIEQEKPHFEG